jgi:predicted porin
LYGRLDASVGSTSTETTGAAPVAKLSQTGVSQSALNTTFWGLKGSEDLGGGLKAFFKLESGFAMDTGSTVAGFERESNLGLAGSFGQVTLGRQYTSYYSSYGATEMLGNGNFAVTSAVDATGLATNGTRAANSLRYDSPKVSGVTGSVTYGFGENKTATADATDNISFNVTYANGPMMATFAHQENTLALNAGTTKFNLIGGTYDLGMAKLNAAYQTTSQGTTDDKMYRIGAVMPMGAFSYGIGYATETSSAPGKADLKSNGVALVGMYDMSKRTTLYVGYKSTKVESAPAAIIADKVTSFQAGVRHTF